LPGLEQAEEDNDEDELEEGTEELLASDFGEDLVPGDETMEASAAEPGQRSVTAIGGSEET
jgi:hypothetical protein